MKICLTKNIISYKINNMKTYYYRHNNGKSQASLIKKSKISFNELTFVLKGQLKYDVNNTLITVNTGDCIFVKQGSIRFRPKAENVDYVSYNFEEDFINIPTYIEDCVSGEIKMLITLCDELYSKYLDWTDKIDVVLTLILKLLNEKLLSREENPIVIEIKRYVKINIEKKLTLNNISRQVGYSPNYCDTLFKKHTGTSILNHVVEQRISLAKSLIIEGALSLNQIAQTVGFEDYNYFSRAFKKKSGYSPTQFKKNTQKKI